MDLTFFNKNELSSKKPQEYPDDHESHTGSSSADFDDDGREEDN